MSTRLKRPSVFRQLGITVLLLGFLAYLGLSALSGQFGFESKQKLLDDIEVLKAEQATLQARIDDFDKRIALFDPERLDPDMLTEQARISLSMANPDDVLIMLDQDN